MLSSVKFYAPFYVLSKVYLLLFIRRKKHVVANNPDATEPFMLKVGLIFCLVEPKL